MKKEGRKEERKENEEERKEGRKEGEEGEEASDLNDIIVRWSEEKRIQNFFAELEQEINLTGGEQRQQLLDRIEQAKGLLSNETALDLLAKWKSPEERLV